MTADQRGHRWVVVLPLKRLGAAKSRLEHPDRALLALAMATDAAAAAAAVGPELVRAVLLVTNDPLARATIAAADPADGSSGVPVLAVPDLPDRGLNPALRHGARVAARRWPDAGVAAMSADLPALRPQELERALRAAPLAGRSVLADTAGTGTVLLCAAPGWPPRPRFGVASHALHVRSGAVDLTEILGSGVPGLRRDVDTVADLAAARLLGVGPATSAVLGASAANAG